MSQGRKRTYQVDLSTLATVTARVTVDHVGSDDVPPELAEELAVQAAHELAQEFVNLRHRGLGWSAEINENFELRDPVVTDLDEMDAPG